MFETITKEVDYQDNNLWHICGVLEIYLACLADEKL